MSFTNNLKQKLKNLKNFKSAFTLPARHMRQANGFSLLEIIIVIAIIGTLAGIIINRISGGADNAKVGITDTKAFTIQSKLIQYQLTHSNSFPTTEQGLQVLLSSQGGVPIATEDDLKDGWDKPFDYRLTQKGPLIISMGKDGQPNGPTSICYLNGKKLETCNSPGEAN